MSFILLGVLNSQVSGAAAGAYDLLETQILASSAASVTFTGLGSYSDYKHLQIRASIKNTDTGDNTRAFRIYFNSDSGNNYSYHQLRGTGSVVTVSSGDNIFPYFQNICVTSSATVGANNFSAFALDILDFSSTTKNKTGRLLGGGTPNNSINLYSFARYNTEALTSLSFIAEDGNWASKTRFSLYGIKGA